MVTTLLHRAGTLALLTLAAAGCASSQHSAGQTNAEAAREPIPDRNRSVNTPGGHLTFGFRAIPRAGTDRIQVVGVLVDLDGEEHVTDLGEWEGELTVVEPGEGELGHLRLVGPESHEFVAVPVNDSELDLLVDGSRVHRLRFEAATRIEADEPLLLDAPALRDSVD